VDTAEDGLEGLDKALTLGTQSYHFITFDISAQWQSLQRTAWELAAAAASILLPGLADGW
jgi:hypothetical protein